MSGFFRYCHKLFCFFIAVKYILIFTPWAVPKSPSLQKLESLLRSVWVLFFVRGGGCYMCHEFWTWTNSFIYSLLTVLSEKTFFIPLLKGHSMKTPPFTQALSISKLLLWPLAVILKTGLQPSLKMFVSYFIAIYILSFKKERFQEGKISTHDSVT